MPLILYELLGLSRHTNWDEADARFGELVEEPDGPIGERHGRDDAVEGGGLWPAARAVADTKVDATKAECFQSRFGVLGELLADVDGVDIGGQLSEQGGLVAGACADFEHAGIGSEFQPFSHFSHEGRLRDGGTVLDGERVVRPGTGFEVR